MIMRGFLAKELSEVVRHPEHDIHEEIERVLTKFKGKPLFKSHTLCCRSFTEMCIERGSEHANVGVILIVVEHQDTDVLRRGPFRQYYTQQYPNLNFPARLWCGFTTASFAIAYATSIESTPKVSLLSIVRVSWVIRTTLQAVILRRPGRDLSKPGLYITSLPL